MGWTNFTYSKFVGKKLRLKKYEKCLHKSRIDILSYSHLTGRTSFFIYFSTFDRIEKWLNQ